MEKTHDNPNLPHADRSRRVFAVFDVDAREAPPSGIWTHVCPHRTGDPLPQDRLGSLDEQLNDNPSWKVINMKLDQQAGPSTFQPLSVITKRVLASCKVTATATEDAKNGATVECARETCNSEDEGLADAAWLDFLAANFPNADDVRTDLGSVT
jgi:hypothetical protein